MPSLKIFKAFLLKKLASKKANNFDIRKTRRILILKYDRVGDMIATTPLIREIKRVLPESSLFVLASKINRDILRYNPYVDNIFINNKNNFLGDIGTLFLLRKMNLDLCIELDHSVIPHSILRLRIIKPKKVFSIHKDGRYGVPGSELKIFDLCTDKNSSATFADIWLEIVNLLGYRPINNSYDIFLSEKEEKDAKLLIKQFKYKFKLVVNLRGSFKEKSISKNNFINFAKEIYNSFPDIQIILISDPKNYDEIEDLELLFSREIDIKAIRTYSILNVAAIIKECDMVITPDTSIVHVASAFNKPIISIHENNLESFRLWKPTSEISKTIFAESNYGIRDINFSEVIRNSKNMINQIKTDDLKS